MQYTTAENSNKLTEKECSSRIHSVDDALYAIGGKWKLRIIAALIDGPMRFNELQRKLNGISARVLSHELKELELNGFAERRVLNTTPATVEYRLTTYSETLYEVIEALRRWGQQHRQVVKQRAVRRVPV
ncbi:helix-turn-helix domain-containing protein [Chitinophaga sp. 212800010-3]|uniref:winged helix-turn-helix transcriptional regulator n=1 Tax=unclassified Chitinophaga TaxID=2619133 RepID=UPI002DE930B6|nr:Transcriptional regulator, HxlR family [Chitinophaga sp. 212800010-3]